MKDDYKVSIGANGKDYGGTVVTLGDGLAMNAIAKRYWASRSIFDPFSWIPGFREKFLGRLFGINSPLFPSEEHTFGARLPGGFSVSFDRDEVWRVHGNSDNNAFFPLGFFGHSIENFTPKIFRMVVYDIYKSRYTFLY